MYILVCVCMCSYVYACTHVCVMWSPCIGMWRLKANGLYLLLVSISGSSEIWSLLEPFWLDSLGRKLQGFSCVCTLGARITDIPSLASLYMVLEIIAPLFMLAKQVLCPFTYSLILCVSLALWSWANTLQPCPLLHL